MDETLREFSNNALNVCKYEGQHRLVVIRVDSILSVVAMVPFGERMAQNFFLIEKFALGIVDTGTIED